MKKSKLAAVLAIVTGILFLLSGFGKLIDTEAFAKLIRQYGLSYFSLLAPFIAALEIVLGLLLLLNIRRRINALIAFVALIVFTAAFGYGFVFHGVTDCGCSGNITFLQTAPWISFVRNIILLAATFFIFRTLPKEEGSSRAPRWKLNILYVAGALAFFVSGLTLLPHEKFTPQHPYYNQLIQNTLLKKYIVTVPDSTYLVFAFSYSCDHCWNSVENIKRYVSSGTVERLLCLGSGDAEAEARFRAHFPDFEVQTIPLDSLGAMVQKFPTTFYIENDTVRIILQDDVPSPFVFSQKREKIREIQQHADE